MSSRSYACLKNYYVWETEVPDRKIPVRKSDDFSLRGAKFYFQLTCVFNEIENENAEDWLFCMAFERPPYPLWKIDVFIENNSGGLHPLVSVKSDAEHLHTCHKYCLRLMDTTEVFEMRMDKHNYLSNDELTFLFTVDEVAKNLPSVEDNDIGVSTSDIHFLNRLSEDMKTVYSNNVYADLEIICDGRSFRVARKLLAVRAPAFAATLPRGNQHNYEDFDCTTFEAFLKFLYTGKINIAVVDMAFALLNMAVKYEMELLAEECESFLACNVTADTVPRAVLAAEEHKCKELLDAVVDFFVADEKDEYLQSNAWRTFADTNLAPALKVCNLMEKKRKEKEEKEDAMDQNKDVSG